MISLRHIIFASVVAPISLALPIFAIAMVGAKLIHPQFHDGQSMPLAEAVQVASFSTSPIYLLLVAVVLVASLVLRYFKRLSRRSLLVVGSASSFVLASLISCDWWDSCETSQLLVNFPLFFSIMLIGSTVLVFSWWRLASNPSLQRTGSASR